MEDGRFDYVETGSLLGIRTKEVASYPVGFEEPFRMHPLDFEEFCLANGVQNQTIELLRSSFLSEKPVSDAVHETMMRLFAAYLVVGGMPEVVQRYVDTHDIAQMLGLQRDITALYRQDIAKYATGGDKAKIRDIFDAIPSQLDDKNRRFVLADLAKTARQNRYESSFLWLADAGVALPCYNVNAPTTPLAANAKHSLFKLFMGDVGLLCASSLGNVQFDILQGNLEVNMGSIVENAVAQELVAPRLQPALLQQQTAGRSGFRCAAGQEGDPHRGEVRQRLATTSRPLQRPRREGVGHRARLRAQQGKRRPRRQGHLPALCT